MTLSSIHQHPLKQQAPSTCIVKLIRGLLEQDVLVKCQSIWNTPILAVPKAGKEGQYRLVQDLRSVNAVVLPLHALVPNPAHILDLIPAVYIFQLLTCNMHSSHCLCTRTASIYLPLLTGDNNIRGQNYLRDLLIWPPCFLNVFKNS